ncbi:hypothetical protein F8M41_012023 [Gigaspora margarita]|uniref:Uncharacterized protein n=1 Tax=Gigaspora margarita TaxID=4874 RepID=A0A8H3WZI7_GIGMA|nr:hypothetical protein F8M41_012023 [Gigaspora margarita]
MSRKDISSTTTTKWHKCRGCFLVMDGLGGGGLRGMPDLSQIQNMMKQMGLVVYQIWKINDKFYSLCFMLKTTKYAN